MFKRITNFFRAKGAEEVLDALLSSFDEQVVVLERCSVELNEQSDALNLRATILRSKAGRAAAASERIGALVSF